MPVDLLRQLLNASLRSLGLGLIALAVLSLFAVRTPSIRHAVWVLVLAGMLLQIPLGMVAPTVPLRMLAAQTQEPTQAAKTDAPQNDVHAVGTRLVTSPEHVQHGNGWVASRDTTFFTDIYLAISMLLLVRMAAGYWGLTRLFRSAKPLPSLGPGVFESNLFVTPGSVGCFRAKIFLPPTWKHWVQSRLRAVLAHENSHIERRDWLVRVISQINVCIFWFHPLAWWIERELAKLAEEACDDAALSGMVDHTEYAATLVEIARAAASCGGVLKRQAIFMAKDSHIAQRVNRILNQRAQSPKPFGRFACMMLVVCALPVIYLSAAVRLTSINRDTILLRQAPAGPAERLPSRSVPEQKTAERRIAQTAPIQNATPAQQFAPSRSKDVPIAMCLVLDNSGSMRDRRAAVKAAALAMVQASKPDDDICIFYFNDEVFSGLPQEKDFADDTKDLEEALTRIDSRGGKALRDAVWLSLEVLQTAHRDRKVLVLVTEGNDSASKISQEQLSTRIKESGLPIYSIGLISKSDPLRASAARLALGQLAQLSGGRAYYPADLTEVENIASLIADQLRNQ